MRTKLDRVNTLETRILRRWSRSHQGLRNYLLIEEEVIMVYYPVNKPPFGINLSTGKSIASYDIPEKKPKEDKQNILDKKHMIYTSIIDNMRTKNYKYIRIKFESGLDIICTSWRDFQKQISM